ncbi:MAG: Alpha-D-kanosaminyltransferase [candidate division WS2 bacterium ADurb.Bin280]|uniref:Alpha-D-kanosaminyltransferase n=1 Tax=candidate division WS2 bacterium ADurb.Bin280 TaxID=1852829 RepID=A0A1V5SDW9_9BACT|nr:MAG: Alpha-D-kanosaminyltransferase [candidate division WS2 bacterium ADurb.Bin280]
MDSIKRILFDGRFLSLSHAGIGRYSCELLKHLLPLDTKQKYLLLVGSGATLDPKLKELLVDRENPVDVIETQATHYSLSEQLVLPRLLDSLKLDLVHFPHFNHPVYYRGKFVATIHDLTLSQFARQSPFAKRIAYQYVMGHAARKSERVLTVSNYVNKQLVKTFNLKKEKVITTYNGVDEQFCNTKDKSSSELFEKYNLKNPYLLYVGQWREHKNLVRLVEAFYQIANDKRWQGKLDLVFAGRVDPKFPNLVKRINELSLSDSVKFTGFVEDEDLPAIYANAEAFVFPSLAEGFGIPGLEAQSCGTPLIASDREFFKEIYSTGAHYFDPENVSDIAEKISQVLDDKALKKSIVQRGYDNIKRFNWNLTATKTLEVYREIVYK